jgi:hypothetical protein
VASEPGDAVYANQNFVTIHGLHSGEKRIRLAQRADVEDLTTGQVIARDAHEITLRLKKGETRWFALTPR